MFSFGQNQNGMNLMQFMKDFEQFRNNFNGDPKAQVQGLLDSGQMTQEQFNQLSAMAQQFGQLIRK